MELWVLVLLVSLTGLLGFELLRKVPPRLHTPLMSGANALSGVVVLGAIVAVGEETAPWVSLLAVALATVNVVGGYLVTDRMLRFFGTDRRRN